MRVTGGSRRWWCAWDGEDKHGGDHCKPTLADSARKTHSYTKRNHCGTPKNLVRVPWLCRHVSVALGSHGPAKEEASLPGTLSRCGLRDRMTRAAQLPVIVAPHPHRHDDSRDLGDRRHDKDGGGNSECVGQQPSQERADGKAHVAPEPVDADGPCTPGGVGNIADGR